MAALQFQPRSEPPRSPLGRGPGRKGKGSQRCRPGPRAGHALRLAPGAARGGPSGPGARGRSGARGADFARDVGRGAEVSAPAPAHPASQALSPAH